MDDDKPAAGRHSPNLDPGEQDLAAEHSSPEAVVIHEIVREEGETALQRTPGALVCSGLAAGLSMGFSFLVPALLRADLPDGGWVHLVASFGYCIGFVIVILGRQQLFTESTLTVILPVLTHRDVATAVAAARLWAIVLVANLVGTWLFTLLLLPHGVVRPELVDELRKGALEAFGDGFGVTVLKAVIAGWLIALMVWLLPSARSARLLTVIIITYVVALGRLPHIIAGSTEAAYAVIVGIASVGDYLWAFLIPSLIGNTIGGMALVGLLNHASVAHDIQSSSQPPTSPDANV
jgi:formate/nitrite transporter FocA (FNT family)